MFIAPIVIPRSIERTFRINTGFRRREVVEKKKRETVIGTRNDDPMVTMRRTESEEVMASSRLSPRGSMDEVGDERFHEEEIVSMVIGPGGGL